MAHRASEKIIDLVQGMVLLVSAVWTGNPENAILKSLFFFGFLHGVN